MRPNDSSLLTVDSSQKMRLKKCFLSAVICELSVIIVFGMCAVSWAQPAPPAGLSVAAPYDGEVNLVWTPAANVTPAVTAYFVSRQLLDLVDSPTPTPTGTLS